MHTTNSRGRLSDSAFGAASAVLAGLALLLGVQSCTFDFDTSNLQYQCQQSEDCPPGHTCNGTTCQPAATADVQDAKDVADTTRPDAVSEVDAPLGDIRPDSDTEEPDYEAICRDQVPPGYYRPICSEPIPLAPLPSCSTVTEFNPAGLWDVMGDPQTAPNLSVGVLTEYDPEACNADAVKDISIAGFLWGQVQFTPDNHFNSVIAALLCVRNSNTVTYLQVTHLVGSGKAQFTPVEGAFAVTLDFDEEGQEDVMLYTILCNKDTLLITQAAGMKEGTLGIPKDIPLVLVFALERKPNR